LSLTLLIAGFCLGFDSFKQACIEGYHAYQNSESLSMISSLDIDGSFSYSDLLYLLSIVVFILSKDKRDDEFINVIRAKALLMALLFATVVLLLISIFNGRLQGIDFLLIQFLSYIIIFKFMKIRADVVGVID